MNEWQFKRYPSSTLHPVIIGPDGDLVVINRQNNRDEEMKRLVDCANKFTGITDEQLAVMPCTVAQMAALITKCQMTISDLVIAHDRLRYMQATRSMSDGEDKARAAAKVQLMTALNNARMLLNSEPDGPNEEDGPWADGWAERSGKS